MTRLKFGIVEYLSASSFKKKKKKKKTTTTTKLQVWIEKVSIGSVSKKKIVVRMINLDLTSHLVSLL